MQAQQVHEHAVFAHAFGVGRRGTAAGEGKKELSHDRDRGEADAGAFARLQGGFVMNALPQSSPAAEGVDQHLAAVRGGLIGVGDLDVEFGFSLGSGGHGLYHHMGDIVSTDFSPWNAFFLIRLTIGAQRMHPSKTFTFTRFTGDSAITCRTQLLT